jgi:LysM repeat protein
MTPLVLEASTPTAPVRDAPAPYYPIDPSAPGEPLAPDAQAAPDAREDRPTRRTVRPVRVRAGAPGGDRRTLELVVAALLAMFVAVVVVTVSTLDHSEPRSGAARAAGRALPPYWTVRRGQTYTTIAARTGLSVDELVTFNPHQDPGALVPGQHIKLRRHVPPLRPRRIGPRFWIVRRGQTFASIAARTGHTISGLQQLNPRLQPSALQPGQRMRLRR